MASPSAHTVLLRKCPKCGELDRVDATKCGFCWTPLTPMPEDSTEAVVGVPFSFKDQHNIDNETYFRNAPRRTCPECGFEIMAAATVCGFCWAKLLPVTA